MKTIYALTLLLFLFQSLMYNRFEDLFVLNSSSLLLFVVDASSFHNYKHHAIFQQPKKMKRRITNFLFHNKKDYTPIIFFTVPKGMNPECDAMEKVISDMECELNIRVERMDIIRQPVNEVLFDMVATTTSSLHTVKSPPLLYHRESCQSYSIPTTTKTTTTPSTSSSQQQVPSSKINRSNFIDKEMIRSLMKGRYLKLSLSSSRQHYTNNLLGSSSPTDYNVNAPNVMMNNPDENDEQQRMNEMLEDMTLTPQQKKGKQLIQQRTDTLRQENEVKKRQQRKQMEQEL